MGDAVVSFLDRTDHVTKNICLTGMRDIKKNKGYIAGPQQWGNLRYRWKDVTSKTRRIVVLLMSVVISSAWAGLCVDTS